MILFGIHQLKASLEPLVQKDERLPLVLCDESKAEHYIIGGLLWLPMIAANSAVEAVRSAKEKRGIPTDARIHCRILFSGEARRRSVFSCLSPDDVHTLLFECVAAMNALGASWFSAWIDRTRYPESLQLVGGNTFDVSEKHLAGLACFAAITNMQHHKGPQYALAYDPDKTKIDWGLVKRQQATHFARTHSNASQLPDRLKPLLEMADVAAYATAQSLIASYAPRNRKAVRFTALYRLMNMRTAEFAYTPWSR